MAAKSFASGSGSALSPTICPCFQLPPHVLSLLCVHVLCICPQEAPFLQRLSEMAEGQQSLWAMSGQAVCLQKPGRGCRKGPATHGRRKASPASHRQAACAGRKQEAGSNRTRRRAQERIKGAKTEVSQRRILAFVRISHQHCGVLDFRPGYRRSHRTLCSALGLTLSAS